MGAAFAARDWAVFQGASEAAIPLWVLPERATRKDGPIPYSPKGCTEKGAGGCVGFSVTAPKGDAPSKPRCPRPLLSATKATPINQRFLKGRIGRMGSKGGVECQRGTAPGASRNLNISRRRRSYRSAQWSTGGSLVRRPDIPDKWRVLAIVGRIVVIIIIIIFIGFVPQACELAGE